VDGKVGLAVAFNVVRADGAAAFDGRFEDAGENIHGEPADSLRRADIDGKNARQGWDRLPSM
jgi:hypothetical protein